MGQGGSPWSEQYTCPRYLLHQEIPQPSSNSCVDPARVSGDLPHNSPDSKASVSTPCGLSSHLSVWPRGNYEGYQTPWQEAG